MRSATSLRGLELLVRWVRGQWRRVRAEGESMVPAIWPGDQLFFEPVSPGYDSAMTAQWVVPGAIVVVRHPWDGARWIVKRVARVAADGLWLSSDNPAGQDSRVFGAVSRQALVGRVRAVVPLGAGRGARS